MTVGSTGVWETIRRIFAVPAPEPRIAPIKKVRDMQASLREFADGSGSLDGFCCSAMRQAVAVASLSRRAQFAGRFGTTAGAEGS